MTETARVIQRTAAARRAESNTSEAAPRRRGSLLKRLGSWSLRLLPFALVIAIWGLLSGFAILDPLLVPAPWTVAQALWEGLFTTGDMWGDLGFTLYRAVLGLVLGCLLGLVIGVLMGESKWVSLLLEPLISFAFPMPKLALLPLLIVLLGIGDSSLIVMVVLGTFFPMVVNTFAGVKGVNRVLLWNSMTLGAGRLQRLRTIVLPASLPHIFSGVRIASGVAFLLVVAAEMISANVGLGYQIIFSQRNYRPDLVIAGILLTAVLGFIIDRIVARTSSMLLAWQDTSQAAS